GWSSISIPKVLLGSSRLRPASRERWGASWRRHSWPNSTGRGSASRSAATTRAPACSTTDRRTTPASGVPCSPAATATRFGPGEPGNTRGARRLEFPLRGAGGEPVDLWRTLNSHGFVDLPPMLLQEQARTLDITIPIAGARPRTVRVSDGNDGRGSVQILGSAPSERTAAGGLAGIEDVLRLGAGLS